MVKVFGDHYDDLWKVEEVEGEKFLIRASSPEYKRKDGGDWSAISDYDAENITLAYKKVPICRFSSEEYEFGDDMFAFKTSLLERASSDSDFIKSILTAQPKSKAEAIGNIFPELKELIK